MDNTKFEKLIDTIEDLLLESIEEGITIHHIELLKVLNEMVRTNEEIKRNVKE
ncbi:MAG: hypothetical protein IJF87_08520 [Erysipelotrichaceae bacterium]|nr:hypothetical protein [Erysipelotrichaceae bacterium]